jgi:hypothetical protein
VDFRLIRACDGSVCLLLFLDRTKAHGRPVVQHGRLRQPGEGGGAPGQKGREMKKRVVTPVSVREAALEPERE